MTSETSSSRHIILQDRRQFDAWDQWLRAELLAIGCWDIVKGTRPRPLPHPTTATLLSQPATTSSNTDENVEDKEADLAFLFQPDADAETDSQGRGALNDTVLEHSVRYPISKLDANADEKKRKKRKKKIKAWDKSARKALGVILKSVHPMLLASIGAEENPRSVYMALYKRFQPRTNGYRAEILDQLLSLRMRPKDTISSLINQAYSLSSKMRIAGLNLPEDLISLLVIKALPSKYKQIRSSINTANADTELTLDWLTTVLTQEERMLKNELVQHPCSNTQSTGGGRVIPGFSKSALYGQQFRKAVPQPGKGRETRPGAGDKPSRPAPMNNPGANCSNCLQQGHTKDKCWC